MNALKSVQQVSVNVNANSFRGSVILLYRSKLYKSMSKPTQNLNIRISEHEKMLLKTYCEQTSRQQSEVVREFLRSLEKKIQKLEASNL